VPQSCKIPNAAGLC